MDDYRLVVFTVLVACIIHESVSQDVVISNQTPDSAAQTGSFVFLDCRPDQAYTGTFAWRFIGSTNVGETVYISPPYKGFQKFDPSRFLKVGDFGLNITSLKWKDGGTYDCTFLQPDIHGVTAVVVIDSPRPLVTPSVVNFNDLVLLNCTVIFGGPNNPAYIAPDQVPQLRMMYGNEDLTQQAVLNYTQGTPGTVPHTLTLSLRRQVTSADVNKQLTCSVSTQRPPFAISSSTNINIRVPAHDVIITPLRSHYAVDDVINCSASGYPEPTIRWVKVNSSSEQQPSNGSLVVSDDMIGGNVWNCVAYNELNTNQLLVPLRFTVDDPFLITVTTAKSKVGLVVGLTIGLLILIAAAVLVAFLIRRRRQAPGKHEVKANTDVRPFIYKPNAGRPSSKTEGRNSQRPGSMSSDDDKHRPPVPMPRVASLNTTLNTSAGGFADLGTAGINSSTDSLHKILDTESDSKKVKAVDRPKRKAHHRGSTESLDKSIDSAVKPIPKERPKGDFRASNESLDKSLESRPQARPRPDLRASNESLDKLVEAQVRFQKPFERSRLSTDRSIDSTTSDHGDKPRPPTAPKPNKNV